MLHVAPETMFRKILKKNIGSGYLTADLNGKGVDIAMDITAIQYADNTFDIIYCSHVLEHVPDDRLAMREFRRVLKPDGWAVILVPITTDKTHEDPSVTDPAERLRRFGQEDHVREYGPDYVDRLREAGFRVEVIRAGDFLDPQEIEQMGITPAAGEIYVCKKN